VQELKSVVWEVSFMPGRPDILASCGADGAVRLWDLPEQRNLLTLEPFGGLDASSVSFTPDGKTLVVTGKDGSLCVWDLEYFDRHMAGSLRHQMELLRPELGDAIQEEYLTTWADEVMSRPWPRIGPHAVPMADKPPSAADASGVDPQVIAAWSRASSPQD
jgi:hypothetical protein